MEAQDPFFLLPRGAVRLGEGFSVVPGESRPLRKSGWRWFSLNLRDAGGRESKDPVIEGIASRGGKDGVQGWLDIAYRDEIVLEKEGGAGDCLSLAARGLDRSLFRVLGGMIPPGGHLMVSYEGDDAVHRETLEALALGVPPAATKLGCLLVVGGFLLVKDWYLAEGGMEGPRKLWAEKAPDAGWGRAFAERTHAQLREFLDRPAASGAKGLLDAARRRAEEVSAALLPP